MFDMTKIEQLAEAAAALTEEQIDGLMAYTRYLSGPSAYATATPEALASIDRGVAQSAAHDTRPAAAVFARLQMKIDAAKI